MSVVYKKRTLSGPPGASAYDIAVQNGFEGTEEEWLESLQGSGTNGLITLPVTQAEYDALSEEEKNADEVAYLITDAKGNSSPLIPGANISNNVYSSEETVIGTWIDDDGVKKPLYRKVYHSTTPVTKNDSKILVPETVQESVINVSGFILTQGVHVPLVCYNSESEYVRSHWIAGKGLEMTTTAWTNKPCTIFLEYTKTTD